MKQTSLNNLSALNTTYKYAESDAGSDVKKVAEIAVEIDKIPNLQGRYLKAGVAQTESTVPTSDEVKGYKSGFARSMVDFCTGLRNIADDSEDKTLIALVNHPYTYFFKAPKNEFAPRAEQVLQGIEGYMKTILAKKLKPEDFLPLRDKLALYEKNKDNAKLIRNKKTVQGTKNLDKIDKDAKKLLQRITNACVSSLPADTELRNGLLAALRIPKDGTQHNAAEITLKNEDGSLFEGQASATDINAKETSIYVVNNKSEIQVPSHKLGKAPFKVTANGKESQTVTIDFKKGITIKIEVILVDSSGK
jgi:hypothetical protein